VGDVAATARAVLAVVPPSRGYRTGPPPHGARWRDVPFSDETGLGRIDPRTLSIALDDLLPAARVVAVDSGNFMGYPSMYLSVPDERGFCFTQAFQSVGLGLATAIGAALAQPDRVPVAALGDGGFLMGISELDTVVRLGLPMVIVVYNDAAYGAEVHHFGPDGYPLDTVTFPDTDLGGRPGGRVEEVDVQRVVMRRVLRMVDVHRRVGQREPALRALAAAVDRDLLGDVGAHGYPFRYRSNQVKIRCQPSTAACG